MFYICETENQLERLEAMGGCGCFCELITSNDNYHPKLSGLVAVYIRPFCSDIIGERFGEIVERAKGYIIPVAHDDGISVSKDRVRQVLEKYRDIWVPNKKSFLYHFILKNNVYDIQLKYAMEHYEKMNIAIKDSTYNWYYNRYGGLENINQIIPLPKIYQKCEEDYEQSKGVISYNLPAGYNFYNEQATKAFFLVEQSGIRVDTHSFIERFKPTNPDFSIVGETVYTSYNLYNITSRPTNSFNAVNFLAIPKGIEFRRCFKPKGHKYVEMDFDGYHLRLVSDLIGYSLSETEKAHKQLAKLRTGKNEISSEEYAQAKADNFKMIYGTPTESDSKLEISQRIQDYIQKLWKIYNRQGYVLNPQSKKSFNLNLQDMYPNKLFNYMIQSLETSRNVLMLCQILGYLARHNAKSRVVLVTYDAFLIDYCEEDGPELIQGLKYVLEGWTDHKISETPVYPVEISEAKDLNFK